MLRTASTICELKFGKQPEIVVHFKDKDPETGETTKKIPFNKPNEPSSYREQISTYVFNKLKDGLMFKKVELFLPHDLLQVIKTRIRKQGTKTREAPNHWIAEYPSIGIS